MGREREGAGRRGEVGGRRGRGEMRQQGMRGLDGIVQGLAAVHMCSGAHTEAHVVAIASVEFL